MSCLATSLGEGHHPLSEKMVVFFTFFLPFTYKYTIQQHFNIEVTKSFSVKHLSDPFCRVAQTKFSRRLVILGLGSVAD